MKKRSLALVLAVVLLLGVALTGCNMFKDTSHALGRIEAAGQLVVGVSPDYPPFAFIDTNHVEDESLKYAGIDMRLMEYVAKELGVKLVIKPVSFDQVLTTAESGGCDIVISGLTADKSRSYLTYTDAYYTGGEAVLLVRTKDQAAISSLDDLKDYKVGVVKDTLTTDQLKKLGVKYGTYGTTKEAVQKLYAGTVTALALDVNTARLVAKENTGYTVTSISLGGAKNEFVMGVVNTKDEKGVDQLMEKLNTIIQKAKDEGKVEEWLTAAIESAAGINNKEDEKTSSSGTNGNTSSSGTASKSSSSK